MSDDDYIPSYEEWKNFNALIKKRGSFDLLAKAAEEGRFNVPTIRRVACIGAGYVGTPTSAVMAQKCPDIDVTVVDLNTRLIERWKSDDDLPIFEPGLEEVVKEARGRNLHFSTDVSTAIRQADCIFISVNTPTKVSGVGAGRAANTKFCELCARTIAEVSESDKIIVEKSTVPVQTADKVAAVLAASCRTPDVRFEVLSNPEFLAEGTAINDLQCPSRVLIGGRQTQSGRAAIEALAKVYEHWVPREKIITSSVWSSELSKLVANALLAQRISSINAVSAICERTNADVSEVSRACAADERIGPRFLQSSVGFGGSCFKKDLNNLVYIAESNGLTEVAQYWSQVNTMNEYQKSRFCAKMLDSCLGTLTGKKVAVLGFAFKKDTGDARETPAAGVVKSLLEERANVFVHDPKVEHATFLNELRHTGISDPDSELLLTHTSDVYDACRQAHCIAVCTDWKEYQELDYESIYASMAKPACIFDGRNFLDHTALNALGFHVYSIGRAALPRAVGA